MKIRKASGGEEFEREILTIDDLERLSVEHSTILSDGKTKRPQSLILHFDASGRLKEVIVYDDYME